MIRYISLLFIFSVLFAQDFTSKDVEKDPINILPIPPIEDENENI